MLKHSLDNIGRGRSAPPMRAVVQAVRRAVQQRDDQIYEKETGRHGVHVEPNPHADRAEAYYSPAKLEKIIEATERKIASYTPENLKFEKNRRALASNKDYLETLKEIQANPIEVESSGTIVGRHEILDSGQFIGEEELALASEGGACERDSLKRRFGKRTI